MLKVNPRAPVESQDARLHREYGWSREDGAITANGVVYREQLLADGLKGFNIFREPHHSDEQMIVAAQELRASSQGAPVSVTEIFTVESRGVAPSRD